MRKKIEKKIKAQLLKRGFTERQLLNNRGLIGATIDEVVLITKKNEQLVCKRCKLLEFMIDNGLGWEDLHNDNT